MGASVRVRRRAGWALAALALPSLVVVMNGHATAAPPEDPSAGGHAGAPSDELPNPQEEKRRELRDAAIQQVLSGEAVPEQRGPSTVVKVGETAAPGDADAAAAEDQYVELAREKTDRIFVILAEFGNVRHPSYPDQDTDPATPGPVGWEGPLHNSIPAPDRSVDNSTVWQPDYSRAHYEDLYFGTEGESVKTYYEWQSSGRYSVEGLVSDWVKVPYNEARYGRSDGFPCASNVCTNTWFLIRDAIDMWVAQQRAGGKTDAQIAADLASYDVWDRYDHDNDGNFNEPDSYIDHFQIVHAGGDQADGDPWQGEDAIWSHRWKAFQSTTTGPPNNRDGGTQIGTTGLWVADYTVQPENGGLSVFAHEFGHDLGLPDLYGTDGSGDNNGVGWWSLMAQSRVSAPQDQGIGTRTADLGPWEKLQLGWLDYEIVVAGDERTLELGPHEYNSDKAQAVVVVLPQKPVVTGVGAPAAGSFQWWSDEGDDLDHTLSRQVTLPAGTAALTFKARWNIEDCGPDPCDYGYVEVDADADGEGWVSIPGTITKAAEGNGIDGYQATWVDANFDLSAYAGTTIGLRFRYHTDGAVTRENTDVPGGLFLDEISVTGGGPPDGAESDTGGWTADGFRRVGASFTTLYDNYYIASNRQYVSFDRYLQTGPYNFGFLPTRPDWAEHFPYQDGLLIWYWDTAYSDNNQAEHPGQGEILPIDSHPRPIYRLDGQVWRGRIQTYDAPFSLEKSDSFTLHFNNRASYIRGQAAVPLFDDARSYWSPVQPTVGVKVPNAGVQIRVLEQVGTSMTIRIAPS